MIKLQDLIFSILLILVGHNVCADRRPFYIVGHMVNSIRQVKHYTDRGSNALESDVQFHPNGSVSYLYHGFPCDCFRTCTYYVQLSDYLEHVRDITDPDIPDSYHKKILLQMFDLKLSTSNNKKESGRDLARHVLDYLWSKDGKRGQEVRVLVYFEDSNDRDVVVGFIEMFKERNQEHRLKDVGFDGGMGSLFDIRRMFLELDIKNIWQGDGKTNCVSALYPDGRLRRAVSLRDSRRGNISKVYHWTIDLKLRMRLSLNLGVDAMITNDPDDLLEVINESYYARDYRLATVEDDPFEKYEE